MTHEVSQNVGLSSHMFSVVLIYVVNKYQVEIQNTKLITSFSLLISSLRHPVNV